MQGVEILAAQFEGVLALEPEHIVAVLLGVLVEDLRLVVRLADSERRQIDHDRTGGEEGKVLELEVMKAGVNIVDQVVVDVVVPIEDISRAGDGRGIGLAGIIALHDESWWMT